MYVAKIMSYFFLRQHCSQELSRANYMSWWYITSERLSKSQTLQINFIWGHIIWDISYDPYDMVHIVWSVLHDRYKFLRDRYRFFNLVELLLRLSQPYPLQHISIKRRYKIFYRVHGPYMKCYLSYGTLRQ